MTKCAMVATQRRKVRLLLVCALLVASAAFFVGAALAATNASPTVSVVGSIGGPGQYPASVNVQLDGQTGQLSGGWSYFDTDAGQHLVATPTCLTYRVLAPSVYDVVITATVTYAGESPEHIVLEVIDDDSPGGTDSVRMSFQHNGGVEQGATSNCWVPVFTPVPISSNTIAITGLTAGSMSPDSTVTVVRTMGGAAQLPASVDVRFDGQTGQLSGGFSYFDAGQHLIATPTCFKYRVLAPSVYDVVITATVAYAGESPEHIVLEAIDDDSPDGTDAARVSFQHNGGVEQGATPNCWVPLSGPVAISPNAIEITTSTLSHRRTPRPPHGPLRVAISHVRTEADGTVAFRVTVPGPGRVDALETAPDGNAARIAALLQPAAHRYVFGRSHTIAHGASTIHMRVRPNARGRLLLRNHTHRVTLRLWVSYSPAGGPSRSVGIDDLHLPCVGDPDHDQDCDARPN
jgi:hypothetical protein